MRDVIGQDDLEQELPARGPERSGGRWRRAPWLTAAVVLAGGAVVLARGELPTGGRPGPGEPAGGRTVPALGPDGDAAGEVPRVTDGVRSDAAGRPAPVLPAEPALRASLAVRPLGGRAVGTDAGARGDLRLEVRNGGAPLRLVSLSAEVPGVRFTAVVRPHGLRLEQEERVELVLGFEIDDCALLRRTGRVVLLVERAGVRSEVGLTVTHDREAGTVRQVALDRVLGACP